MSFESLKFDSKPKIDILKKIKECNNLSDIKFNAAILGILSAGIMLK